MATLLTSPRASDGTHDRRSRLLRAATRAFAACGFKGANLRDIAADAEVSLTLVNHHFGTKERLLEAVVFHHHEVCKHRMAGFRASLKVDGNAESLAQLAAAWTRHEFELLQTDAGMDYLLLSVKLLSDEQVAPSLRQMLDCSEPVILHALALAAPNSTRTSRDRAFRLARGALQAALLEAGPADDPASAEDVAGVIGGCADFIHAGLSALLP